MTLSDTADCWDRTGPQAGDLPGRKGTGTASTGQFFKGVGDRGGLAGGALRYLQVPQTSMTHKERP